MPCGKCPVFSFCQEGGPVNATECVYIEDWLTGNRGGWTNEAELREQKELKERTQRAEAEAREAAKAKKAERERLKKLGERVEEEGMVEDDDHDGMASGREDADEGWDD
jgi:DNA-directed RNA polymerase III subunit RPC6